MQGREEEAKVDPSTCFEGVEKKVVLRFSGAWDARSIDRQTWDKVLEQAGCTIVGQRSFPLVDSYILSESSLFVFADRVVLKTCGRTRVLAALPGIVLAARKAGAELAGVAFSRTDYVFPDQQLDPHRAFGDECRVLDRLEPEAGWADKACWSEGGWHVYSAAASQPSELLVDLAMFGLHPDAAAPFLRYRADTLAAEVEEAAGLRSIFYDDGVSDSKLMQGHLFRPCGYSCNGVRSPAVHGDGAYLTVHVTPEPWQSYASVESVVRDAEDCWQVVRRSLDTFRPRAARLLVSGADPKTSAGPCLPGFDVVSSRPVGDGRWLVVQLAASN